MQTVGELLKSFRIKSKLTLTQVSRLTHIPLKTLIALEKNQFSRLPSATYIQGFIQNYAEVVNLDPHQAVAVFKRDFDRQKAKVLIPRGLTTPLNNSFNYQWLAAALVGGTILTYLGLTIFNLFQPPKLFIEKPQSGEEVTAPVLIKGKTDWDASLTLNDKTINLEPDGSFTATNFASELRFKTTSRRGKSRELVLHVIIVP